MSEERNNDQRVWDVYDAYRTARLNVRYYEAQLKKLRRVNLWMEFLLAVSASSGVAGLWFLETAIGGYAWKVLGILVAFLAVLKPLLKLTAKIQAKSEILTDYRSLDHDFKKIIISISQYKKYDEKLRNQFIVLLDRTGEIIKKYTDEHINQKLRKRCTQIVNTELPVSNFYIPEE